MGKTRSCGCLNKERIRPKTWCLPSKSSTLFLNNIEKLFGITIEREYRLNHRYFDGKFNNILIEVDNSYWHKNTQKNDLYKDNIALNNGFTIIRCQVESIKQVPQAIEQYKESIIKAFTLKGIL